MGSGSESWSRRVLSVPLGQGPIPHETRGPGDRLKDSLHRGNVLRFLPNGDETRRLVSVRGWVTTPVRLPRGSIH